jgi:hypothetical protein
LRTATLPLTSETELMDAMRCELNGDLLDSLVMCEASKRLHASTLGKNPRFLTRADLCLWIGYINVERISF